MLKWENKTDTFDEEQRYYKNIYLEICEVYDEFLEVSIFSAMDGTFEIYVSFGSLYGIVYADNEEAAYTLFDKIKNELETEYQKSKEPTDEFIDTFAEKYNLCLPNDIFCDFDIEDLF